MVHLAKSILSANITVESNTVPLFQSQSDWETRATKTCIEFLRCRDPTWYRTESRSLSPPVTQSKCLRLQIDNANDYIIPVQKDQTAQHNCHWYNIFSSTHSLSDLSRSTCINLISQKLTQTTRSNKMILKNDKTNFNNASVHLNYFCQFYITYFFLN